MKSGNLLVLAGAIVGVAAIGSGILASIRYTRVQGLIDDGLRTYQMQSNEQAVTPAEQAKREKAVGEVREKLKPLDSLGVVEVYWRTASWAELSVGLLGVGIAMNKSSRPRMGIKGIGATGGVCPYCRSTDISIDWRGWGDRHSDWRYVLYELIPILGAISIIRYLKSNRRCGKCKGSFLVGKP